MTDYQKKLAALKHEASTLLNAEIKSSARCNQIAARAKELGDNFPHNGGPQWGILSPIFQKTNAWHLSNVEAWVKSGKNVPA